MATIRAALFLLVTTYLVITQETQAETTGDGCITNCNKAEDGSYQSCTHCNLYIQCYNGHSKEKKCTRKKVWDDSKKKCTGTSTTCTPIVVPGEADCMGDDHGKEKYARPKGTTRQPNILYILADDLGWNDWGITNPEFHTPVLNTLARSQGRIFDHLYMQHVCTPTRTAFMTGRNPSRDWMSHFILAGFNPHCVPFDVPFLPQKLRALGYENHIMGKWHLGFCQKECTPTERGWDTFVGQYGGQGDQFRHESQPPDPIWYDWRNNHELDLTANGTHITDVLNNNAIKLLRGMDKDQPWFLFLTHTVPHHPLQVPDEYLELFPDEPDHERKLVKAMMAHLDARTGDLVNVLREEGFYDNTLIIFTSDNGGDVEAHHDNSPLRGGKGSLFEAGSRVPGFVHSPLLKNTEINGHHNGLLHITDLHSTILSLAGGYVDNPMLDGVDQTEMIMNGYGTQRTEMFYNVDLQEPAYFGHAAYRDAVYKIIWGHDGWADGYGLDAVPSHDTRENIIALGLDPDNYDNTPDARAQRNLDLINLRGLKMDADNNIDINSGNVRLYNLQEDPEERNNLADDPMQAARVLSMKIKILQYIDEYYDGPPQTSMEFWAPQAFAARENGAWAMGWCDGLEFDRNKRDLVSE